MLGYCPCVAFPAPAGLEASVALTRTIPSGDAGRSACGADGRVPRLAVEHVRISNAGYQSTDAALLCSSNRIQLLVRFILGVYAPLVDHKCLVAKP